MSEGKEGRTHVDIFYPITIGAGGEADYTIYTVSAARKLRVKKIEIWFPLGTDREVEVYVKRGVEQVLPDEGAYVGDNIVVVGEKEIEYGGESKVVVHVKNTNTTESKFISVHMKGVLE